MRPDFKPRFWEGFPHFEWELVELRHLNSGAGRGGCQGCSVWAQMLPVAEKSTVFKRGCDWTFRAGKHWNIIASFFKETGKISVFSIVHIARISKFRFRGVLEADTSGGFWIGDFCLTEPMSPKTFVWLFASIFLKLFFRSCLKNG